MKLRNFIKDNIVLLDGAMGTLLQKEGLKPGEFPETWNLRHPDVIAGIHQSYFDAGSNIVCTNTFGANLLKFSRDELEKIIAAAVDNARTARDKSSSRQEKFIALDVGPLGKLLKPFGDFAFERAVEIFAATVEIGSRCGADLVLVETVNDSYEAKAAVLAAKENSDLPIFATNAYGEDKKLMTGATPQAMVALLEGLGVDALGANCSLGPVQLRDVAAELVENSSVPVILKPNAGMPALRDGKTVFDVTAQEFVAEVARAVERGVRIVGGCCGTTPEYIRLLRESVRNLRPLPVTPKNITLVSSYTHAVSFGARPVLIGERINPTGKKRFKQALIENDIDYILNEGIRQEEKGVHILDVNVGLPDIDEAAMLESCVYELQSVVNLPLQIDTSDVAAMERALRIYNGKALVNSVNGKEENMAAVFPLIKKYGGVVVALTLDEGGIPETADGRFAIAQKILERAAQYGIEKKDIIFDTLAMTISADTSAALATLDSLGRIARELDCRTSLGVSNSSFGLPQRDCINSLFFAAALERGLSAAIMNPFSAEMMKTYYAYNAIHNLDPNCQQYIAFAGSYVSAGGLDAAGGTNSNVGASSAGATKSAAGMDATVVAASSGERTAGANADEGSPLQKAIVKGLKEQAGELTADLLKSREPLDIVQQEIIPALDKVGVGFEKKTVYLPQLLMSAEAAKSAFEKIKSALSGTNRTEAAKSAKGRVVVATVEGDIHDIGKNIVKLLLENYGYQVIDLGKDVKPERVLEAVKETNAPVVGLSALMTTTVPNMEKTVALLKKEVPACKTIVGGAVLTKEYAEKMGADFYAKDAMETVRITESLG